MQTVKALGAHELFKVASEGGRIVGILSRAASMMMPAVGHGGQPTRRESRCWTAIVEFALDESSLEQAEVSSRGDGEVEKTGKRMMDYGSAQAGSPLLAFTQWGESAEVGREYRVSKTGM